MLMRRHVLTDPFNHRLTALRAASVVRACAGAGLCLGLWLAQPALAGSATPLPPAAEASMRAAPANPLEGLERLGNVQPDQALAQLSALIQTMPASNAARIQALALRGVL
ncbi:MAG: hypothetical protein CFE45_30025, partial [Burkholderiales bacterium PBB5]